MTGENRSTVVKNKPKVVNGWSYNTSKKLGDGGNGDVFLAKKEGRDGALKELRIDIRKRDKAHVKKQIARFRDEVVALKQCADIPGVIPVLDVDIGTDPNQRPWFVMGLAKPLSKQLGKLPFLPDVVQAIHDIAQVLETMHGRGFSHRDIKPDNLFFYEERWTVGDFGLVSFEGKQGKTQPNERIGPIYYNAPEMLNDAIEADGRPADVFSLAKTLWVLATGQRFALPGAYDLNHEAFRIGTYLPAAERTAQLDNLIASATAFAPERRPTMAQVRTDLQAWLLPHEESNLAIKFDISKFGAQIDQHQRAMDMEAAREAARQSQLAEAAERVWQAHTSFADEVVAGLKDARLNDVGHRWAKADRTLTIRGRIPGVSPCALVLQIVVDDLQSPNLKVTGRILLEWADKPEAQLLVWKESLQFLSAGSEERHALQRLQSQAIEQLQKAVEQAFIMTLASGSASSLDSYAVNVIDSDGVAVVGAHVCLVNGNAATFSGRTDSQGNVVFGPHPFDTPIAFVAHPDYLGAMRWELTFHTQIQLSGSKGEGSFIAIDAANHWPDLESRLNLIHHNLNRSYMYAKPGVIDHGVNQPGAIALGQDTHVDDEKGHPILICPQAVRGEVFLVNVKRLYG